MLGCLEESSCGEALRKPKTIAAERRCLIMSRGGEMLSDWPDSLPALLSRTLHQDPSGEKTRLVFRGLKQIRTKAYSFSRPVELATTAMLTTPRRKHTKLALESIGYLTGQGFAEHASIKLNEVRKLRLAGAISHRVINDGNRPRLVFPTQDAINTRRSRNSRVSARRVAQRLNISIDGVFDMVADSMLTPTTDQVVQCLWDKLHVDPGGARLLINCLEQGLSRETPPRHSIRLGFALRRYPGPAKPWPAIIQALLAAKLDLYSSHPSKLDLSNCFVPEDQVELILQLPLTEKRAEGPKKPSWLRESDVWEMLNCASRQVRALIADESLVSTGLYNGDTFARSVVEELARTRVHPTELRALLGVPAQARVGEHLRRLGLEPDEAGFFERAHAFEALGLDSFG